jgi:hypothetical protein
VDARGRSVYPIIGYAGQPEARFRRAGRRPEYHGRKKEALWSQANSSLNSGCSSVRPARRSSLSPRTILMRSLTACSKSSLTTT